MTVGRDNHGRFTTEPCPDRGRGRPPARPRLILDEDMHRIVMSTANLAVSIPRGRGRRVVTLYEAQIRKLASGRVAGRAAVLRFVRLVQEAAALAPVPRPEPAPPAAVTHLQTQLDELRAVAASPDATRMDQRSVAFFELLLDVVSRRLPG